jgi:2-hydroxychromene-2-carboxylate isomerase
MAKTVNFYFDFMSPYSYFAWLNLKSFKEKNDIELNLYPVVLANLLNHWEQKGPGEIVPKRDYMLKACLRYAIKNEIQFTTPKTHPFNPLYSLRMAVIENAGDKQWEVIDTLWKAGWQQRIDMGDPEELTRALNEAGLNGDEIYEKCFERDVKKALKANIKTAITAGAFGVPTFLVEGELFWGNDAYADLELFIKNADVLDHERFQQLIDSTPRAAQQKL